LRRRTLSRELVLKFLYQVDITKDDWQQLIADFWQEKNTDEKVKQFANTLIEGTLSNLEAIDKVIAQRAENWQLSRMAVVDRNILRLACFELIFMSDIPSKVSINEAINLAKKYGDVESGKFVNGILDKVKKDISDKYKE
jgi:N utilization substance protein B